jgi:hypothetical protein
LKNFFFIIDQINVILFYSTVDKASKEILSHLHFFKNQTFGDDYIFHWEKNKQLSRKSRVIGKYSTVNLLMQEIIDLQITSKINSFNNVFFYKKYVNLLTNYWAEILTRSFSFGFYYLRGLFFILFIDACLTDDEPL